MSDRRLTTQRLELVTATTQHLLVHLEDPHKLARLLGAELASDWNADVVAETRLRQTMNRLYRGPQELPWSIRYVLARKGVAERRTLVGVLDLGDGPKDGAVMLAISIVPSFAERGLQREAVQALADWCFGHDSTERVEVTGFDEATRAALLEDDFVAQADDVLVEDRQTWAAKGPGARHTPPLRPQPSDAPIDGLPSVARSIFERLLREEPRDTAALRTETRDYLDAIERAATYNPAVDLDVAQDIARVCEGLLDAITADTPSWTKQQIQAVVRYFVTEEDGDSDLDIGGLDEDAAVANAVATHLGRADLVSDPLSP